MNQFYVDRESFSIPREDYGPELDNLCYRLYNDEFYQNMLYSGLEICKKILIDAFKKYIEVQLISFRGSVVLGTVTPDEDIDITIISKRTHRLFNRLQKKIPEFEQDLKNRCPTLTRLHPLSIYLIKIPQSHFKRNKLFRENPIELEMITQTEQDMSRTMRRKVYKFQRDSLKPIADTVLSDPALNSIKAVELARKIGKEIYKIERDTVHSATSIFQARSMGINFMREEGLKENNIVKNRNTLIEEKYGDMFAEMQLMVEK